MEYMSRPEPTIRFSGKCKPCKLPIAQDRPDWDGKHLPATCRLCGASVLLERIYGVLTGQPCHGACMSARGPICECGCGGENHGGLFVWRDEMTASEVAAYDAAVEKYRAEIAKRQAAAARKREKEQERKTAEGAAWRKDNADVVAWLAAWREGSDDAFGFLNDMAAKVTAGEALSENMVAALRRNMARDAQRKAERERQAQAVADGTAEPLPAGKAVKVTGTVVGIRWDPKPRGYGEVPKITVKGDAGWRVWGTAADSLFGGPRPLVGAVVEFTADVEAKEDDFGFFKRPRQARVVKESEEEVAS